MAQTDQQTSHVDQKGQKLLLGVVSTSTADALSFACFGKMDQRPALQITLTRARKELDTNPNLDDTHQLDGLRDELLTS